MPNPSEVRVLRDELARAMAEVTKRDAALERQRAQIEQLGIQNERQRAQIEQLRAQPGRGGGAGASHTTRTRTARRRRTPCRKGGRRGPREGIRQTAKSLGGGLDTGPMEAAAAPVARRFGLRPAGRTPAAKLANAVPLLSTFANRPGVDPASNESERMPGRAAMARKIRLGIAGLEGARMFPSIVTCMPTWRERNLNVSDMLLKVLSGT